MVASQPAETAWGAIAAGSLGQNALVTSTAAIPGRRWGRPPGGTSANPDRQTRGGKALPARPHTSPTPSEATDRISSLAHGAGDPPRPHPGSSGW